MPSDSPVVTDVDIEQEVCRIVCEVLVVPREVVTLDANLIDDLGAESIDFLDLLFRFEELLGKKIPIANLEAYAYHEANGQHPVYAFTVRTLADFAKSEARR
jgi:acyl carrier protein